MSNVVTLVVRVVCPGSEICGLDRNLDRHVSVYINIIYVTLFLQPYIIYIRDMHMHIYSYAYVLRCIYRYDMHASSRYMYI